MPGSVENLIPKTPDIEVFDNTDGVPKTLKTCALRRRFWFHFQVAQIDYYSELWGSPRIQQLSC
jgi:hypothetical protein